MRNSKDATGFADKIRRELNADGNIEVKTVDEVGKEVFVAYNLHGGYQSSFTVKNEYPSQFQDGGAYVVNNTIMLPRIPEGVDPDVAQKQVQELVSGYRKGRTAKVRSRPDPESDEMAVSISFDKIELDEFLELLSQLSDGFSLDEYRD